MLFRANLATGINTLNNIIAFETFPNPSTGIFTIVQGAKDKTQIEIYNIGGELIYRTTITAPQTTIDLSKQPKGIYFMRITDGRQNLTEKIIIGQ